MNLKRRAFERIFKGKARVPYRMKIRGDSYTLETRLRWKYNFFMGFVNKLSDKANKKISLPDKFDADPRTHSMLLKNLKRVLDSIQATERRKLPGFAFLSTNIKSGTYYREGEDMVLRITIEGLCKHDV